MSTEEALRFGLSFALFESLDVGGLNKYLHWKRAAVGRALANSSGALFSSGLPVWASAVCFAYLQGAAIRVKHLSPDPGDIAFHPPALDASPG